MKGSRRINFRLIAIIVGAVVALALVFLLLYNVLFPRVSYRQLVFSVTEDGAVITAEALRQGSSIWLTDKQILAVESWLAEYRSENEGISHADEHSGYELRLNFADPDGRTEIIYIEPDAIVFSGILGNYRITVETNDIYDLISGLENN